MIQMHEKEKKKKEEERVQMRKKCNIIGISSIKKGMRRTQCCGLCASMGKTHANTQEGICFLLC